ncbi:hypothetical protein Tsubulata_019474 [Turnera subulata]|uniref:F-box domain-containing protein n=1 Tax=Turnera subulata TaxID=218843 RepID=A0A9Q0JLZ8_9ROSI|nr:hypothetical protein Tsubulata_019474 [Turnera subulata]
MDTLLHTPTSMAKRPCPFSSTNPGATARLPSSGHQMDSLLPTFLSLADSPSLSFDLSFERLLDASPSDADQSVLIDHALKLGSMLLEAGKRSARKRSTNHNSIAWALPPDLTIKVFSLLDTQSLCYAAATCTMFHKCAMDPFCYSNIDLTAVVPKINNGVVSTMIQRAGKALHSLRLGIVPGPIISPGSCQPLVYSIRNSIDVSNFSWNDKKTRQGKESNILTRSCLNPLSADNGGAGTLLRRLHLYNIERIDNLALCTALSACPSLLDLEVVGLHVELRQTLESVSTNCPLIERLFFESSKTGRDDSLKSQTCVDLVNNCQNLTSLALRGFKLQDCKVRILVKDVSNREGLASSSDCFRRCFNSSFPIKQVSEARPDLCLLAEFPSEDSFIEIDQIIDSEPNSEISLPAQFFRQIISDGSFMSTSDSSYSSDQSSGNEESQDSGYVVFEESSDEVDFLVV